MKHETLIIGGGIAGMSAALELKEHGRDVALVTEEIGGRICYKPEYASNFGAVFYMDNYTHSKKLLTENHLMAPKMSDLMLHTSKTKVFKGNSPIMVKSMPQMLKLHHFMSNQFIPEYTQYKQDCETLQVIAAMEKHPAIKRYFLMKASELIEELDISDICDNFVSKFAYACTGSRVNELNALDFLNVAQGIIIPIFDFTFNEQSFVEKLDGKVIQDTIVAIEKTEEGWKAAGVGGEEYTSTYLVVATTGLVTQKLLGIEAIRQPTTLVSYLVEGTPHKDIAKAVAHYYSDEFDIIAINARPDGRFNVYSRAEISLDHYFDDPQIVYHRVWPEALFTHDSIIQRQDWDENLWIAGDINGLGLEPAAISGVYAAGRILAHLNQ